MREFRLLVLAVAFAGAALVLPGRVWADDTAATSEVTASDAAPAAAEPAAEGASGTAAAAPVPGAVLPAFPAAEDEFPGWAHDLRRFEIIGFGTLPFTLFTTQFVFDFYMCATHNWLSTYAPWPLKSDASYTPSAGEATGIILTAIGASVVCAAIDFVILKLRKRKPKTDAITIQDIVRMQQKTQEKTGANASTTSK